MDKVTQPCAICTTTEGVGLDHHPQTDVVVGYLCFECKTKVNLYRGLVSDPDFGFIKEYVRMTSK